MLKQRFATDLPRSRRRLFRYVTKAISEYVNYTFSKNLVEFILQLALLLLKNTEQLSIFKKKSILTYLEDRIGYDNGVCFKSSSATNGLFWLIPIISQFFLQVQLFNKINLREYSIRTSVGFTKIKNLQYKGSVGTSILSKANQRFQVYHDELKYSVLSLPPPEKNMNDFECLSPGWFRKY